MPSVVRNGSLVFEAGSGLNVLADGDDRFWTCATCSTELGDAEKNYKEGCIREDHPVTDSNPLIGAPERFIDDLVTFRQFFCPGCGRLIDNEVAVDSDPVLADITVAA
jgi:acetone carboxylase gamma subunit